MYKGRIAPINAWEETKGGEHCIVPMGRYSTSINMAIVQTLDLSGHRKVLIEGHLSLKKRKCQSLYYKDEHLKIIIKKWIHELSCYGGLEDKCSDATILTVRRKATSRPFYRPSHPGICSHGWVRRNRGCSARWRMHGSNRLNIEQEIYDSDSILSRYISSLLTSTTRPTQDFGCEYNSCECLEDSAKTEDGRKCANIQPASTLCYCMRALGSFTSLQSRSEMSPWKSHSERPTIYADRSCPRKEERLSSRYKKIESVDET